MWDTNVYQQTCKGSTRRTEKERSRKIFEKLVAKNFPFPKKFKSTYQEVQQTASRINSKRPMNRHIVNMPKKILKAAREK